MAVGFVIDDLPLKESADTGMGEIAEFVGAHRQIGGKRLPVFVGNLLSNELAYVDPHLFIRLQGLLQIVALGSLIIEDSESRLGWLGAAVACGDDRIVVRVILPHAALPLEGELVGKRRLGAVS